MMRAFFISLSLIFSAALSGCGFTPMHGGAGGGTSLADINIDLVKGSNVVDNQAGFFITQRLRDRIGTNSDNAAYRLEITPDYSRRRLGLTNADIASRYDITVTAKWKLYDSKSGKALKRGTTSAVTSFGAPSGPYGVITADNVGVEQSAKETAEKLILDIARYFAAAAKK